MDTAILRLTLSGPLQSWGDRSKFWNRQTQAFPTKSGIIGLIFCALGLGGPQKENLQLFSNLPMKVFRVGESAKEIRPILSDFHMVGNGYDDQDPWQLECIPKTAEGKKAVGGGARLTYREYLQDESFEVLIHIPEEWSKRIKEGLLNPVWDLYLGRKSCAPTEIIFGGIFKSEESALEEMNKSLSNRKPEPWVILNACEEVGVDEPGAVQLYDVPLAFGRKKVYGVRYVKQS